MDYRLELRLTSAQMVKLQELAKVRSEQLRKPVTPEEAVLMLIEACQPGGSGWTNPAVTKGGE